MLAIVEAVRMWRQKFIIQTDQRSLKYFLEQKLATPKRQKWLAKLMGYNTKLIIVKMQQPMLCHDGPTVLLLTIYLCRR